MEDMERNQNIEPERKFRFEIGNRGEPVTFAPLDGPIYLGPSSRPIAGEYTITLAPEFSELQQNTFFTNLMENTISHTRGQRESLSYWGSDLGGTIELKQWRREGFPGDCADIGRGLEGWDRLTPKIKTLIENAVFDFNGAWQDLPVNDETFPSLWQARFFGIDPKKVSTRNYDFPKIKFKFLDGKEDWSEVLKIVKGKAEEVESGFERDGVLTVFVMEQERIGPMRNYESLSEIVKRDWPNAAYAVGLEGRSWKCPVIVLDQAEKNQSIYEEYASQWRSQLTDGEKRIVAIPALDETGLPSVSSEVVAGPMVAEAGYRVMVPGEIPNEDYKKILAHVINDWISLDALDHYSVTPSERSFYAFDRYERSLLTEEDRRLWEGFCKWIRDEGLKIDFMNPVEFSEQVFRRKTEKSGLN